MNAISNPFDLMLPYDMAGDTCELYTVVLYRTAFHTISPQCGRVCWIAIHGDPSTISESEKYMEGTLLHYDNDGWPEEITAKKQLITE